MKQPVILSLDQGTTSTRCLAIAPDGMTVASAQRELQQHYPQPGWVEHDGEQILADALFCLRQVIETLSHEYQPVAIGITNQRETTLVWDRANGKPIHRAIVWQDRRTSDLCSRLKSAGHEKTVSEKTGLLLDPYFSASKVAWILDHVDGARERAEKGQLAFGTVETFLLWHLTGGDKHISDETNAARTSLWNIHTGRWDTDLLDLFNVPANLLPDVVPSAYRFGESDPDILGVTLPICGMAGDQQSASFGQLCLSAGQMKATYGTGCFVLMNTGGKAVSSQNKLLTTRACRIGGEPQFALEGSIFMAGAISQWLRDEMGLIVSSDETEALASSIDSTNGVYLVPAFTGLGAPHWDSEVRAAIFGMTRQTGKAEIVRAAMEAVTYQTSDLIQAFAADGGMPDLVRVDGGMSANGWLMQYISDMTGIRLERPANLETTALGAAFLAGLTIGVWNSTDDLHKLGGEVTGFIPDTNTEHRSMAMEGWHKAIRAAQAFSD
ncbi:MAG: glycerol kinase GlpK [Pseudomonadota bacterium]